MAKKTLSHKDAVRFGKMGGSPILLSWVRKHPVMGYKVTRGKNGKKG